MNPFRTAVTTAAALSLVSASLFAAAAVLPANVVAAPVGRTDVLSTSVVHRRVRSTGRYEVRVVVTTRADNRIEVSRGVRVDIGRLSRRVTTNARGRATLRVKLHVKKGTLTIRVISQHATATIAMTMSRIARKAPSTKATGPTGATGPAAPAVAAPLVAAFAPDGAPILALPASFAPIVNYTNLVKDYEFVPSGRLDGERQRLARHGHDVPALAGHDDRLLGRADRDQPAERRLPDHLGLDLDRGPVFIDARPDRLQRRDAGGPGIVVGSVA